MKIQLLLLLSVSGLWSAVQRGQCSEQTHKHLEDTQPDGETHTQKRREDQLQMPGPSMSSSLFISGVDSSSSVKPDVSSRISDIFPVPAAPGVCGSSCRDCSSSCSDETLDSSSSSACGASEGPLYDSQLSFPAAQENISIREGRKPTKEQTRKRSNASRILKEQGSGGSADTDPSLPCRDQQIPSFDEWTKIMMEVENEKSQVTQHLSHSLHTPGKKIQQIFTNYASVECGAKILSSNPEAKSTSAILMENMDMYMLNPCNNKIWFIIELCQPIQVKQLDIANFEIFSSNPKDFLVSISDRYPTKKWVKLGTFHARDQRTVQSFPLDEHLFAKYIKVELLSHYRSEHFCPLSLIRVFGTSMMEEYELNSETSDKQTQAQEDHDYDPSAEFEDKSSRNLIGSAKDALFTMVNNIAANVIGGDPETAGRPGNFSTKGLNMTEAAERPEAPHSATAEGSVAVLEGQLDVSESASVPPEAPSLSDAPDQQWIVTLLPEAEDELDTDGSEADRWSTQSLQEYLLQQCSAPVIRPSVTQSPVIHTQTPSVPEAHSLLESSLSSRVSAEHLSLGATQALELTSASVSDRSDQETMEETLPGSDVMSTASHTVTSGSSPLNDTSAPAASTDTPDGLEMKNRELLDDDSNVDQSSEMDTELQNSSDAPVHSGSQKESVFMRLNNRIKVLEMNMSLSGRYLEQLSQRYRKQVEEMQRAFNKTIIKLQNTSRMAEEQDQRQTDSIQVLQAQLENVTGLVLSLSVSVSRLQQEVSDRQNYILLCLLLGVLLCLLICVNYHQMCESPAIDSQRSCFSDREPPEDEQVFLRRRASDPPSLSSLHAADGSGQTGGLQQWERCSVSKKKKNKLKQSPESLIAPSPATVIPQITVGPEGLEARDVMMSDGSSEGSSQADETLFCGIASCTRLCDALPAPKRWTQSSSRPQRGSRRAAERLHQPAQRTDPLPISTQRSRI